MRLLKRNRAPQSFASQCTRVRTPQGRKAHYRHPEHGVLCGWPGAEVEAERSLELCKLCEVAAETADAVRSS